MLQQTQASRVISKYKEFIKHFPSFNALAQASTKEVLIAWSGLGYNRRALNLKKTAEITIKKYEGKLPPSPKELEKLPGIGPNTAGSTSAFAFNSPIVFIETNIRSVFIHFFFKRKTSIHDRDIIPLIEKTLDKKNPCEWYWALMDYGSMLKQTLPNPSRQSRHHTKQSKFEGSRRQLRSRILKLVLKDSLTPRQIQEYLGSSPELTQALLTDLTKEGFITGKNGRFSVAK